MTDPDETYRISLTAYELIENVVKYSTEGPSKVAVGLSEDAGQVYASVETSNRSTPDAITTLRGLVERLGQAADPHDVYGELIASCPQREGSGLGLARICAEAGMGLSLSVDGDEVTIRARAPMHSLKASHG